MTEQPREQRGVSRRTIAKGAAWAVPALPIVAATPAYAASGGPPRITFRSACKLPGGSCEKEYGIKWGYTMVLGVSNTTGEDIWIYPNLVASPPTQAALNPQIIATGGDLTITYDSAFLYNGTTVVGTEFTGSVMIPSGGSIQILVVVAGANSANTNIVGNLWMAWGHDADRLDDTDHPYTPGPPATTTLGEGWVRVPFDTFTPPCKDCSPGTTTTTTSTTAAPAAASQTAETVDSADAAPTAESTQTADSSDTTPTADSSQTTESPDSNG